MYPQGVCRIRKPACAGNGCAIFPIFQTAGWEQKIRRQPQTIYSEFPLVYNQKACCETDLTARFCYCFSTSSTRSVCSVT